MDISRNIFRAYDIRGKYPEEINEDTAYLIGKGLATVLNEKNLKKVYIGKDHRKNSQKILDSVVKGLVDSGIFVFVQKGIVPAPLVNYVMCEHDFDLGLIVTASHLSNNHSGIKISYKNALPMADEQLQDLYSLIEKENFIIGTGRIENVDYVNEYVDMLVSKFNFKNSFKVLLACGNGAFSEIAPIVLDKLGIKVVSHNCDYKKELDINGDPRSKEFTGNIYSKMMNKEFDLGIGFDSDGDRFNAIGSKGETYYFDTFGILFAEKIKKENPGAIIAADIKCTAFSDLVFPTGRTHFVTAIKNDNVIFGIEYSGHTFFGDKYYGIDDGLYAILRLLEIMDTEEKTFVELMDQYPKRYKAELKIEISDNKKFDLVQKIREEIESDPNFSNLTTIDGVRANVSDTGWFLVRASNTSNYINIIVESTDNEEKERILEMINVKIMA